MCRIFNAMELPKNTIIRIERNSKTLKNPQIKIMGLTLPLRFLAVSFEYNHYCIVTKISPKTIEILDLYKTPNEGFHCRKQPVEMSNLVLDLDLDLDFNSGVYICEQEFAMKEDEKSIEIRKNEMMTKGKIFYSLNEDIGDNCKSVAFYIRYGVKNIAPIKKELIESNGLFKGSLVVWASKYINYLNKDIFKSGFNNHKKN